MSRAAVLLIRVSRPTVGAACTMTGVNGAVHAWRRLARWMSDPYRPELHYMRGPGPKWRERHGQGPAA